LVLPAREVTAVAGHVAGRFRAAQRSGFDVNPVTWHTRRRSESDRQM
jgi:hypothetical protein